MRCAGSGLEVPEFKREQHSHWSTQSPMKVRYEVVVPQVGSVPVNYQNAYLDYRGTQPTDVVGTVAYLIDPTIGTIAPHFRTGAMKIAQCPDCQQWVQWVKGRLQEHSRLEAA